MGYAGKLLRVNLSTGEIKTEQLDFALSRMFLGGQRFGKQDTLR